MYNLRNNARLCFMFILYWAYGYKAQQLCTHDYQCPGDLECVAGICDLKCDAALYITGCKRNQLCVFQQCVYKCSQNTDCLDNQVCAEGLCTQSCQSTDGCSCPSVRNSICDAGKCLRRCRSSLDCPYFTPFVCAEGICRHSTLCSEGCSPHTKCKPYQCIVHCNDTSCPGTHTCSAGLCLSKIGQACPVDGCGCGQFCKNGVCQPVQRIGASCQGGLCGINEFCNRAGICDCVKGRNGRCISSFPSCLSGTSTCGAWAPGALCNPVDKICSCSDGALISGMCYEKINVCGPTYELCVSTSHCRSSHCYPTCFPNKPCPNDMVCYEGVCAIKCQRSSDCDYNQACLNAVCVQLCGPSTACDSIRQMCDGYRCRLDCLKPGATCASDAICLPSVGCVTRCFRDDHCLPGEICISGICGSRCLSDSQCSPLATCLNGRCYTKCSRSDVVPKCTTEQICNAELCMSKCQDAKECFSGEVCSDGKCRVTCYSSADCFSSKQICFGGLCSVSCPNGDIDCNAGDDCQLRNGIHGCISTCASTCSAVQECNNENNLCYPIYMRQCNGFGSCPYAHVCQNKTGEEAGVCQPMVMVGKRCNTTSECGMNEICVFGLCDCIKNHDGKCIGPFPACPSLLSYATCKSELNGSVCNLVTQLCECQPGYSIIARTCLKITVCSSSAECPDGSCMSNHCYPECSNVNSCNDPFTCFNGLCVLRCIGDGNCDFNQTCVEGVCISKCTVDAQCAKNHKCDITVHLCRRSCLTNSDCQNSVQLSEICVNNLCTPRCTSSLNCPTKTVCAGSGRCEKICAGDQDCLAGEHCIGRSCMPRCNVSSDCPSDSQCFLGICYPACTNNDQCRKRPGSRCYNGACVQLCDRSMDPACGGSACASGICSAWCSTDNATCPGGGTCLTSRGGCHINCSLDSECGPGQYCDGTFCTYVYGRDCSTSSAVCGSEIFCVLGKCTRLSKLGDPCSSASDCGPAEYCDGLSQCDCVASQATGCLKYTKCGGDSDCSGLGSFTYCNSSMGNCMCQPGSRLFPNNKCAAEFKGCKSINECPSGHACFDSSCHMRCVSDGDCSSSTKCSNGLCFHSCSSGNRCPSSSQSCVGGACISMCTSSYASGSLCVEGIVTTSCTTSCSSGYVCEQNACLLSCASNSDCAANQICETGICRCNRVSYICPDPKSRNISSLFVTCVINKDCPLPLEMCSSGQCSCQVGAMRDRNGACVWNTDIACLGCPPCIGSCSGSNMVCNTLSRTCVCAPGYRLDATKVSCSQNSGESTSIPCKGPNDCQLMPGAVCNPYTGRCLCRTGFCFINGDCVLDTNECSNSACKSGTTCVNTPCRAAPVCTDEDTLTSSATIGVNDEQIGCLSSLDCRTYRGRDCENTNCGVVYCFHGKCTCERGSVTHAYNLINTYTQEIVKKYTCRAIYCQSVVECGTDSICTDHGVCVSIVVVTNVTGDALTAPKNRTAILIGVILGAIVGLAILILLIVAAYLKFAPSEAEKMKRFWEAEEKRLAKEEADLDRLEKEYEEERRRRQAEYERQLLEKKKQKARERAEREERERLKREEEEMLLRQEQERQEAERLKRLEEEKLAKEQEKKLAAEARKKAEAERKAKAEAEKKRLEAEAAEKKRQIEEARRLREEEEKARIAAEKAKEEAEKRAHEEAERAAREAQKAKIEAMKREMDEERRKRAAALKAKTDAIKKKNEEEMRRLAEERKKRMASVMNADEEEEEDDEDKAESGWTHAPKMGHVK